MNLGLDGLKQIPKKLLDEYLTEAQKSIAWSDPGSADLAYYTIGYAGGFVTEQIVLSIATSAFKAAVVLPAITKLGSTVATMMSAAKTGQKILGAVDEARAVLAKVQRAKNLATRAATQFVTEKLGLDELDAMVKRLLPTSGCE